MILLITFPTDIYESFNENQPLLIQKQQKPSYSSKISKMRHMISRSLQRLPNSSRSGLFIKSSPSANNETQYTWWTKFYNSMNPNAQKHSLVIFDCELENRREFQNLHDWAEPVALHSQNGSQKKAIQFIDKSYADLKINVKVRKYFGNGQVDEELRNKM